MREEWYGDKRDLIKWGVLLRLAERYEAQRIIQVAYYRPSEFGPLIINGERHEVPPEVLAHFRHLGSAGGIGSEVRVAQPPTSRPTWRSSSRRRPNPRVACRATLAPDPA